MEDGGVAIWAENGLVIPGTDNLNVKGNMETGIARAPRDGGIRYKLQILT